MSGTFMSRGHQIIEMKGTWRDDTEAVTTHKAGIVAQVGTNRQPSKDACSVDTLSSHAAS